MNARILLLTTALGLRSLFAAEPTVVEPPAEKVATLDDKRINESSGLARSLRHPGVFWTHNDSGGEPSLFAIDQQGRTVAKVHLREAANFDWEDIASGLDENGKPVLYVGDIGDNFHLRPSLQIYQIPEPDLPADPKHEILSETPQIWHLAYPKGRLNAESLLVHPRTGQIYVITKDDNGHSTLYACPQPLKTGTALILEKVTDIVLPAETRPGRRPKDAQQATAADFSADGSRLLIASYSRFYEWTLTPKTSLNEALQQPPTVILPPALRQIEGVCYDADHRTLWFTSERLPTPLYRMQRP